MLSELPEVDFDGISLPKIVLGCDPFECYTAFYPNPEEKLETYTKRFSDTNTILDIVSAATSKGINALNLTRHKNLVEAAERIRKNKLEITFVPLVYRIPIKIGDEPVPVARTEATVFQHFKHLLDSIKSQPLYQELVQTPLIKTAESTSPLNQEEIKNLRLNKEKIEEVLKWFKEKGSVRLAMTCVELFALTERFDLLKEAIDLFEKIGFTICAGVHIADVFGILQRENIRFKAYYAPLNKIGFFMLQNEKEMLEYLLKMKEPLIAIKPLAGGRIKPQEAFNYIFSLRENVVCMPGLSSVQEVEEAIEAFHMRAHKS